MAATLIGLAGMVASRAQTDEEVSALVAEALLFPDWDTVISATAGTGFKDNVFLSHANPKSSPFASLSGELMILRLASEGPRFNFLANAEGRYFSEVSHHEFTLFSQASLERDFNDTFTGALAAQYFYQDQVLDVSVSETNRQAVPVLGHTINLRPRLRARLRGDNWLEIEPSATRQFFEKPLDDYWETGAKFTLGHDYGRDSHVALSYEPLWRPYDNDLARTAAGQVITNSQRFFFRQEARVSWRHHWDEEKHWRTLVTVGTRFNEENGGGYSDYTRWFASARIRYRAHGWEIYAEGRLAEYDYSTQTVSATNPSLRNRTEWSATLSVERKLTKTCELVVSYEYETTGSNDPLETHSVNTVSASLRWEF